MKAVQHWQKIALILAMYDFFSVLIAYTFALFLRFDFVFSSIPLIFLQRHQKLIFLYAAFCIVIYFLFKLYHSLWRFASYIELLHCIMSITVSFIVFLSVSLIWFRMPVSYYLIGLFLQAVFAVGLRFMFRFVNLLKSRNSVEKTVNRVLLIGAGSAGQMIIRDVMENRNITDDKICAIIDDNPNKWGRYIEGVKVVGGREEIFSAVKTYKINKIYFAIPSISADDKREILNICNETGCQLKQIPNLYQLADGQVHVSGLKEVNIEDLLGREPIKIRMDEVFRFITGKTVLVTGGGGSIGSEICRQVASHLPKCLIVFDIYENNAYDISNELKHDYPELNLVTLIGSVRDFHRLDYVFSRYRPDIVYHAAAHKHVPLMEDNPCEAIKNNVFGTYKTAFAALKYGTDRFVLISSDKAVNPTNIMGASKRLCEMIVQSFAKKVQCGNATELPSFEEHGMEYLEKAEVGTNFVSVRFGNVLGSNGSVVPLFKKQIANGGPVTVTHSDIIRYFMTVQEAVSLVLQAGTYAKGGEIFVLDMGSPMKIDTLARNLICLSGLKPDEDIKIEYTGLRPGEKLYEEKLMAEEGLQRTANDLIFIGKPLPFDENEFIDELAILKKLAYSNDEVNIRPAVMKVVDTYHPALN